MTKKKEKKLDKLEKICVIIGFTIMGIGILIWFFDLIKGLKIIYGGFGLIAIGYFVFTSQTYLNYKYDKIKET